MQLSQLVGYLDEYLRVREIPDSSEALNGLQVGGRAEVTRVAAAVDLCEATVRLAAEQGVDFLIVHHGLFWGGLQPLTGPRLRRVAGLLSHDIALYGAHLPLDLHHDVGNNPVLARALGIKITGQFGESRGVAIGVWGELAVSRAELEQRLARALGGPPKVLPFGPERTQRGMIGQAAAAGLDTFITGEGMHHCYFDAEELGLNVFLGGHYATETMGVKALAEHLQSRFGLPWV